MKPRVFISVACAVLLAAAATAHGLTAEDGSGTYTLPGTSGSSVDPDGPAGETAEFRLLGIALSNSPGQTLAVIETGPERRQKFIREGDTIGAMSVKRILSDRVVFDTGRGERIAKMNRAFLDVGSDGGTPMIHQPVSVRLPPAANEKIVEVEGEKLSASLANIEKVVQQVSINPIAVYGQPIGVRIYPIDPGGIFEELGLETGDIITAVNGQEIRKPEEAIAFLDQIRTGGDFDISIRGSRRDKIVRLIVN
jgi:general secretion pathway protein C